MLLEAQQHIDLMVMNSLNQLLIRSGLEYDGNGRLVEELSTTAVNERNQAGEDINQHTYSYDDAVNRGRN